MLAMLKDRQRAFYKPGRIMALGPINPKIYSKACFNLYQGFSHEQSIYACLSLILILSGLISDLDFMLT